MNFGHLSNPNIMDRKESLLFSLFCIGKRPKETKEAHLVQRIGMRNKDLGFYLSKIPQNALFNLCKNSE
jgi:hypothetical protein